MTIVTRATRLKIGLIRNIMKIQPAAPRKETKRGILKVGRKLMIFILCWIKVTKFRVPYVMRKNMVISEARTSRLPMIRAKIMIKPVK